MISNMAPGTENDPRSGCHDDIDVECPYCYGDGEIDESECGVCDGTSKIPLSLFKILKAEERKEDQANE